jgi:NADH-quinone oxidoreductase subunit M
MPMFPHGAAVWGPAISILAVIGIIYGAFVAFAQDDVKKLVAYSSVSHLGFCALGIFALNEYGIEGSIYAMLSHGLTTGGLFLGIGVLYERRHTRRLAEYGGVWKVMPVFAGLFLVITMGSAGLPALSGFVGEFLTLLGTFVSGPGPKETAAQAATLVPHPMLLGALATTGVIFGAVYLLYMFQKVFFGKLDPARNGALRDLSGRELGTFIPLVIVIFLMGLFPRPFLTSMEKSTQKFVTDMKQRIAECDGPVHRYGTMLPGPDGKCPPEKTAQSAPTDLQKGLDGVAKGAQGVSQTLSQGGSK